MTEREAYIALNMMEKIGPVRVRSLASVLGSVQAIFDAPREALAAARGVGPGQVAAILGERERKDPVAEQERAGRAGARILTPVDEEYPRPLRAIHDPPLALYVRGELQQRDRQAIAIVGTRHPSHYGRGVSETLARQLARAGVTVVSGLAEGIDTCAHRGALRGEGRTLAVLGSALDSIYPRSNTGLAGEIEGQGAVMTELPFGRQADRTTFPMRNRIVSGLSKGVVVVEAGARSGALITVRQATDQGRTVFAVPGRIDQPVARGCLALLKDGAVLVTSVDDILQEFEFLLSPLVREQTAERGPQPAVSEDEARLLGLLEGGEQDVDTLIRSSGLKPGTVNSILLRLEMKKRVRMLPGRLVELFR